MVLISPNLPLRINKYRTTLPDRILPGSLSGRSSMRATFFLYRHQHQVKQKLLCMRGDSTSYTQQMAHPHPNAATLLDMICTESAPISRKTCAKRTSVWKLLIGCPSERLIWGRSEHVGNLERRNIYRGPISEHMMYVPSCLGSRGRSTTLAYDVSVPCKPIDVQRCKIWW